MNYLLFISNLTFFYLLFRSISNGLIEIWEKIQNLMPNWFALLHELIMKSNDNNFIRKLMLIIVKLFDNLIVIFVKFNKEIPTEFISKLNPFLFCSLFEHLEKLTALTHSSEYEEFILKLKDKLQNCDFESIIIQQINNTFKNDQNKPLDSIILNELIRIFIIEKKQQQMNLKIIYKIIQCLFLNYKTISNEQLIEYKFYYSEFSILSQKLFNLLLSNNNYQLVFIDHFQDNTADYISILMEKLLSLFFSDIIEVQNEQSNDCGDLKLKIDQYFNDNWTFFTDIVSIMFNEYLSFCILIEKLFANIIDNFLNNIFQDNFQNYFR